MTVCVAVKVHDCIVFAADSATSLVSSNGDGTSGISNVYFHGNKVFNLKKGLPIAAMTCGMGNIGPVSISTLTKDFRQLLTDGPPEWRVDNAAYTMEEVAHKARKFFYDDKYAALVHKPVGPHSFEFWLGGNDTSEIHGEIWKVAIINGQCADPEKIAGQSDFNLFYGGQPEAINRLVLGYSQRLPAALLDAGLVQQNLEPMMAHIQDHTFEQLAIPAMPVQDAIDLADFLVDTTKRFVRFQLGADVVGGATDICAVTKHEGFKWIRRKHYFTTALNPVGGQT